MSESFTNQNTIVLNPDHAGLDELKEEAQRIMVTKTLQDTEGNIAEAARRLMISRPRLYDLMSRYGLCRSKAIIQHQQ